MTIRKIDGVTLDADTLDGINAALFALLTDLATHAALETGIHGKVLLVKPDDQIVNNSEVLVDDEDLVLPVGANDVWYIIVVFLVQSETVGPGIDYKWTVPTDGTLKKMATMSYTDRITWVDGTTEQSISVAAPIDPLLYKMMYFGGGTAGNLQLQWAQGTATAEDTRMKKDSFLLCFQLA